MGIARKGREGGLNACQDGLGHFKCPNQMLDCGGVKMLARIVWGTYDKGVWGRGLTQLHMMIVVFIAYLFKITPSLFFNCWQESSNVGGC